MKNPILLLICAALALSACADRGDSTQTTSDSTQTSSAASESPQAIAKYNAYVKAFNEFDGDFFRHHEFAERYTEEGYDFSSFRYSADGPLGGMPRLKGNLEKALALPGDHPLDAPAREYLAAVSPLLPLDEQLGYYSSSKGYLNDQGSKGRALAAELLPLLRAAAQAQYAFSRAIDEEDENNIRAAMNQHADGTLEKSNITSVYHSGRILRGFQHLLAAMDAGEDDADIKQQLLQDIEALDQNTQAYLANFKDQSYCSRYADMLSEMVGKSRDSLRKAEAGRYRLPLESQWDKMLWGPSIPESDRKLAINSLASYQAVIVANHNRSGSCMPRPI